MLGNLNTVSNNIITTNLWFVTSILLMKKLRLRKFISQGQTVNKQRSNYSDSNLPEFPLFHSNFEIDFHWGKHSTYLKIKKKKILAPAGPTK